jgi:Sulfotransferase domain
MRFVKWNLSSRARDLSGADAIVVSIPKSGRTWVRTFLCAYYCAKARKPFSLQPEQISGAPCIVYTHDLFEERTKGDRWDKVRGKYLIPRGERRRCPIILLARDPRDAFVSLYVQLTRRTKETPNELKTKSASELLRDPAFGLGSMIEVMNRWLAEWEARPHFLLVRYESLREDPRAGFARLLHSLGESPPDEEALTQAVEFSAFGNMKKLETAGAFGSKILRAGDTADPESFKVRRGKIGGFADYLSPEDQEFATSMLAKLDPRFGYFVTKKNAIPKTT